MEKFFKKFSFRFFHTFIYLVNDQWLQSVSILLLNIYGIETGCSSGIRTGSLILE
jgi:hypothetical protein